MKVFAFHGDGARPWHLRDDMGNPTWVDEYPDWMRQNQEQLIAELAAEESVILVGYSSGGGFIADVLSHRLGNITGAVVYESPVRSGRPPGGEFPVMMIWNRGSRKAASKMACEAMEAWVANSRRKWRLVFGDGGHTRWAWRPRTLFRAHNWDASVSPKAERFIGQPNKS